jgi:putative chitinase
MCIVDSVGQGCANTPADVRTVQILLNLNHPAAGSRVVVDGIMGQNTMTNISTFQTGPMGLPLSDGRVDPDSATLRALARGIPAGLSATTLQGIMIDADASRVALFTDALVSEVAARAIDTPLRQAHFLAQIGHESGELRYTEEIASGDAYEGRLDLGNTQPGDGKRFKGRGLIQLTGRTNYEVYGKSIGVDLLTGGNWQRVATDPHLAVDVACWFWQTRNLNVLADADDISAITRRVNGGLNGLVDRQRILTRGKFFLVR